MSPSASTLVRMQETILHYFGVFVYLPLMVCATVALVLLVTNCQLSAFIIPSSSHQSAPTDHSHPTLLIDMRLPITFLIPHGPSGIADSVRFKRTHARTQTHTDALICGRLLVSKVALFSLRD